MQIVNETHYHDNTPQKVIAILEDSRINNRRLKIYYGEPATKTYWGDIVNGRIGRSMGPQKIPLIIKTKRSTGGEGVLDHCIVQIDREGKTVYTA